MLFYHFHLKCYVVVEMKAVSFEPELAGKLNFYVNAVNELIRTPDENPTIGLLICKDKDQTEVQWAFQGIQTPMGVASYDNIRLEEIKKQLPTEKEIQRRIELAEEFNLNRKKLPTSKTDLPIFKTIGFREENKRQKFFTISKTGKLKTEPLSISHKSSIPSKSSQSR